jgi:hypothetical protein
MAAAGIDARSCNPDLMGQSSKSLRLHARRASSVLRAWYQSGLARLIAPAVKNPKAPRSAREAEEDWGR